MQIDLRCGDCLKILPTLAAGSVDAVVTDPPWGIDADTDYRRFSGPGGMAPFWGTEFKPIAGDDRPFDPTPWLRFPIVALCGAHCFARELSVGRWLVWVKKPASNLGKFMSDAELCWINRKPTPRRAPGVYVKHHVWDGMNRQTERGKSLHPTQKPVAIMEWTLERAGVKSGMTVLDPYMGSGSTGVAAVSMGFNFIGIELDRKYFNIACRRINAALKEVA